MFPCWQPVTALWKYAGDELGANSKSSQVIWLLFYLLDPFEANKFFCLKTGVESCKWNLLTDHNPIPFVEVINLKNACQPLGDVWLQPRLGRPANDLQYRQQVAFYVSSAKRRMSLQAAARAWANGMPWATALKVCTRVIKRADARAKAIPKRKAAWWFCMLQFAGIWGTSSNFMTKATIEICNFQKITLRQYRLGVFFLVDEWLEMQFWLSRGIQFSHQVSNATPGWTQRLGWRTRALDFHAPFGIDLSAVFCEKKNQHKIRHSTLQNRHRFFPVQMSYLTKSDTPSSNTHHGFSWCKCRLLKNPTHTIIPGPVFFCVIYIQRIPTPRVVGLQANQKNLSVEVFKSRHLNPASLVCKSLCISVEVDLNLDTKCATYWSWNLCPAQGWGGHKFLSDFMESKGFFLE